MRRAVFIVAALAAVFLYGCASKPQYVHPDRSQSQQERDFSECDWEVARATGNIPKGSERNELVESLLEKCMKAKGYKKNW